MLLHIIYTKIAVFRLDFATKAPVLLFRSKFSKLPVVNTHQPITLVVRNRCHIGLLMQHQQQCVSQHQSFDNLMQIMSNSRPVFTNILKYTLNVVQFQLCSVRGSAPNTFASFSRISVCGHDCQSHFSPLEHILNFVHFFTRVYVRTLFFFLGFLFRHPVWERP